MVGYPLEHAHKGSEIFLENFKGSEHFFEKVKGCDKIAFRRKNIPSVNPVVRIAKRNVASAIVEMGI